MQTSGVTIKGIKFWGEPTQPEFPAKNSWCWNETRGSDEMKAIWQAMPEDTDVLITHGPPKGYGDPSSTGQSVGCEDQLRRLIDVKPKVVVCGHLHSGNGVYPIKDIGTLVVNTSICNEQYQPIQSPYLIDINEDTKQVESIIEVNTGDIVYENA